MAPRIFRRNLVAVMVVFIMALAFLHRKIHFAIIDIGYLIRPLWDKDIQDFDQVITHYYAEGMSMKDRCDAHGWSLPTDPNHRVPKVYDAILFSVELDLLEIRLHELWDSVDYFVIMESNTTFTGQPKEMTFAKNRERFAFAESKILYNNKPLPEWEGMSVWDREGGMRRGMRDFLVESGIQLGDVYTVADLDEIPNGHVLDLFKSCVGSPEAIHIQLMNYMYSFEFPTGASIWKTSIRKWTTNSFYGHGQFSKTLLMQAGWHCSFCFRKIADFQFKVGAYSHSDRVRYEYMKSPEWIQRQICDGADLFGMFPEAYSFKELFAQIGSIPKSKNAVHLPRYLLENRQKFKFLLPGGCIREDGPSKF
ncbi:hypothetical protein BG004_008338 [Podila humilis]|nr:hypothetical protein BG004_008338 [Podila humilis]